MSTGVRVVFDCNTFLQALASPEGPPGRCMQLAIDGKVHLFISRFVLDELREVSSRPRVIAKLHLVFEYVQEFLEAVEIAATLIDGYSDVFEYQRDPDDSPYINLALAANASLIVSRDRDLLDLMDATKPEAAEFQRRFPALRIVNPVVFLSEFGE